MGTEIVWELKSGQIQAIDLDAVIRESPDSTATPTEHAIESGANISDHVRKNLDRVSLEIVVSNTPTREPKTQMDGATASSGGVEFAQRQEVFGVGVGPFDLSLGIVNTIKANVLVFDSEFDRVRSIYELLQDLQDAGQVIEILTPHREYTDMVITRISPVWTADTREALMATLEAQQIRIVDSEIVEAADPEQARDGASTNRGRQNATEDEDPENRNSSILNDILERLGG